jgi:uncharacterized protein YgiM (DUF1202 family)
VVLDPGVNIQLRQFPSSEAFSLGLAPSGTILAVNGREGGPADADGNPIPLEDGTDWVDPATLLADETADLEPGQTWLNIIYSTPDGGTITAWVNAQFLDVDDPRGNRQRLAALPLVPRNQPGEAQNTGVTSPTAQEAFVEAIVTQLDAGVNLNIRRTAASDSEVLARVASGTALELIGLGESGDWAFVRYRPLEGGAITGWANTQYLAYQFRGAPIDFEEMETRELLDPVDEATLRGDVSDDAPALSEPTRSPLRDVIVGTVIPLNEGILLNLRRNPNAQSEVIAKIPSGTQLVITSQTLSGEWLQTEFEGVAGWVSTQYVTLSFNQRAFLLADVPFNDDLVVLASATATMTSDAPPTATTAATAATATATP